MWVFALQLWFQPLFRLWVFALQLWFQSLFRLWVFALQLWLQSLFRLWVFALQLWFQSLFRLWVFALRLWFQSLFRLWVYALRLRFQPLVRLWGLVLEIDRFFQHCLDQLKSAHGPSAWANLRVEDLCLSNIITAVRLNNGECGLALNYDREGAGDRISDGVAERLRVRLLERAMKEPLLLGTLFQNEEGATFRSLSVALLNALSQSLINPLHLTPRGASVCSGRIPIDALREGGSRVAVIGCGGYLEDALYADFVTEVVCSDYNFGNAEAMEHYRPFMENVVEPQREAKNLRLTDGIDNQRVVSECDLLFITGSALVNGSLLQLLDWAGDKPAIVVEGNTAGLYPFPLFELGVTHLVQTVVDLDYVSLNRRFARQVREGFLDMQAARYSEIVLPETRTLERLPTFDHRRRLGPRSKKVLLLQARDWGDPMIEHEIECFRDQIPDQFELACYNLVEGPWDASVLEGFSAIMVGGSGAYGSAHNDNSWFEPTLSLLRAIVEKGVPLYCSCWGHQALAVALGGRVEHDERGYELGLLPVQLTFEGERDELFGKLPSPFVAPLGHCEQVVKLPEGAELLASTERCRVQAYRLRGKPVYSTQFHPELNKERLKQRVSAYIPEEWQEKLEGDECITGGIISDFLNRFG